MHDQSLASYDPEVHDATRAELSRQRSTLELIATKSNLILGMGETREEISQALRDLHAAGCELVTIAQYLRPSVRHHPVERWVKREEFVELAVEAEEIGFAGVLSGPLVRSSYRAGRLYRQAIRHRAGRDGGVARCL
jgi:lipoic acid synthetase